MNKKITALVENLKIYQCEIFNLTQDVKQIQNWSNPEKRMIAKDLITTLKTAEAQLEELARELQEKL